MIKADKAGARTQLAVGDGLVYALTSDGKRQDGSDHITAMDGDKILLSQLPEDGCNIEVQVNQKNPGLHASAYAPRLGGGEPLRSTEFIAAAPPEQTKPM